MRCCRRAFWIMCVGSSLLCSTGVAQVPAQAPDLPAAIKSAASVDAQRATIDGFISQHIQNLGNVESPSTQSESRKALVAGARLSDTAKPSPAYMDVYARTLNASLKELAKDANMRTRLNAAIVTAQVAEQADNVQLAEAAAAFLKDESTPVALWGLKAAKWIVPPLLRNPGIQNNLIAQIVPVVKKHQSGIMAQEAYDALSLNFMADNRNLNNQLVGAIMPQLLDLLEYRVGLYVAGIPEDPRADEKPTLFLANAQVWNSMAPAQQTRAMQAMTDLLTLSAQQAPNARPEQRDPLARLIQQTARAMFVVADGMGAAGLTAALTPASNVDPRTPPASLPGIVGPVYNAVIAVKNFASVQPASRLPAGGPATTNSAQ